MHAILILYYQYITIIHLLLQYSLKLKFFIILVCLVFILAIVLLVYLALCYQGVWLPMHVGGSGHSSLVTTSCWSNVLLRRAILTGVL